MCHCNLPSFEEYVPSEHRLQEAALIAPAPIMLAPQTSYSNYCSSMPLRILVFCVAFSLYTIALDVLLSSIFAGSKSLDTLTSSRCTVHTSYVTMMLRDFTYPCSCNNFQQDMKCKLHCL